MFRFAMCAPDAQEMRARWSQDWMFALWQVACVAKTIIQVKGMGFTQTEIDELVRMQTATALVEEMFVVR